MTPEIKDKELHRITATAIIYNDEGKYLITKRSPHKKAMPNKWTVPGGGLSTDDYTNTEAVHNQWYFALEKTLRREIKEEVNLEVGDLKYLLDLTFIHPKGFPVIVLSYYAPYKSGEVELDEDATEYAWVSLAEAKDCDLIEGIYGELEMVEKVLKNK